MSQKCYCCGELTGWFTWSSGRNFPTEELIKRKSIKGKQSINMVKHNGYPVCYRCLGELRK